MSKGWTGTLLRVNLTTGSITTESSEQYHGYLGGKGLANRVMYDEVPVGTMPYDEENKVVFAVGPNTGSSAPCSGRITISSLSTFTKNNAIVDAHMGGETAVQLKCAGYDAVIIEGKSSSPVYLKIHDSDVTIEDASWLWGMTTRDTAAELAMVHGSDFNVASIGPAGENLINLACMINSNGNSGGAGIGAVLGSKNLKAIATCGTGAVTIDDVSKVIELNNYVMSDLMGSNNNHVVPSVMQSFSEYSSSSSRWTGQPGLTWGAAEGGPVDTGESPPGEPTLMGYRCQKAYKDLGAMSEQYTVKMTGCTSCPVRCKGSVYMPLLEADGVHAAYSNTCIPHSQWAKTNVTGGVYKDYAEEGDGSLYYKVAGGSTADDLGLWCNYGEISKTINYFFADDCALLKQILPDDEYDSLLWDKREEGDFAFMKDIMYRIANREGELYNLGMGAYYVQEKYGDLLGDAYMADSGMCIWSPNGWAKHHGNETAAQVGTLINMMYNRDCMCHTHVNITGSGLPGELQVSIIEGLFGEGALDLPGYYTPMNANKAKFAKFSIIKQVIHDSITLCNWVWPMTFSPCADRGYEGDLSVESQYMEAITGDTWTEDSLDDAAERVFQLHRAMTVKAWGTTDMRNEHDTANDWIYDADPEMNAFDEGTNKMDRDDMQTALTMFYAEWGWDETTGAPTRETLEKFDLADVADDLDALGLLP